MKKILFIALFAIFGAAQSQVTFRPGLRAGANFSHFSKGNDYNSYYIDNNGNYINDSNQDNFRSKTDFYVGFYGALRLTKFYTLQPEVGYTRQGTVFKANNGSVNLDVSYLSVGIANKFTFADKFNIHVGPTIDVVTDSNFETETDIDLAFFLGAGFNFTRNFGIEARVKKGIIPVMDTYYSDNYHTNVVFSVGVTYTFDLK